MTRKLKKVSRTLAKKLAEHTILLYRKDEMFDGRDNIEGYFKLAEIKGKVYTVNSSALKTRASGVDIVSGQQAFDPKYKAMFLDIKFVQENGEEIIVSSDDELLVREKDGTLHHNLFKITETPVDPSLYGSFYEAKLQVLDMPFYLEGNQLIHEEVPDGGI